MSTPKLFTPSSEHLLSMIASAEARFDAARKRALAEERFDRAVKINTLIMREERAHDVRRRVNAGG